MHKKVWLVGAGPGDEGLITVKGLDCIKKADVIIYDNLINDNLLSYSKDSAEKIYVGKKINQHTLPQDEINKLLVQKANENKLIVRLKGGDPYVFGRGGEEAIALQEANIPFVEVPGISSSIAALAYSGIPITHRGLSTSFHVITGHEDPTKEEEHVNYESLAKISGTLVFLMGLNNITKICSKLMQYGKSSDTPAAIISKGSTPEQKVAVGTLGDISQKAEGIAYPAIIVIGEVVNLREYLNWFEKQPLFGKKIMVTRARHQASRLSKMIAEAGGQPIEFSTIEIIHNEDDLQINTMFENLSSYDWLIFTSINGVETFFNNLKNHNNDIRNIGSAKICAIGESTKQAIEKYYLQVEFCPEEFIAESLIEGLKDKIKAGDKVLIPRAEVAREVIPDELIKFGANVDIIPLYKTIIPAHSREKLIDILNDIDIITFCSSSTVSNFVQILGNENLHFLNNIEIACIGPVTANTAKGLNINVNKIAEEYTIDGLVTKLTEK